MRKNGIRWCALNDANEDFFLSFFFFFFEKSRCGLDAYQTYGGCRDEPQHVLLMAIITQNYIFIHKHTHAHLRSLTNTHTLRPCLVCVHHRTSLHNTVMQTIKQLWQTRRRRRRRHQHQHEDQQQMIWNRNKTTFSTRALRSARNKFIKIIYFRKLNIEWTRARRERGNEKTIKRGRKKRNRNVYETAQRFTKINDRISKIFTPKCVRERVSE